MADVHFKYKGFSFMVEYANRTTTDGSPVVNMDETYYTGYAVNTQIGYIMKNNWEVVSRYTKVTPQQITMNNNITQYTIGISKYVVGHNLKVQGDISYTEEETQKGIIMVRLQTEFNF